MLTLTNNAKKTKRKIKFYHFLCSYFGFTFAYKKLSKLIKFDMPSIVLTESYPPMDFTNKENMFVDSIELNFNSFQNVLYLYDKDKKMIKKLFLPSLKKPQDCITIIDNLLVVQTNYLFVGKNKIYLFLIENDLVESQLLLQISI